MRAGAVTPPVTTQELATVERKPASRAGPGGGTAARGGSQASRMACISAVVSTRASFVGAFNEIVRRGWGLPDWAAQIFRITIIWVLITAADVLCGEARSLQVSGRWVGVFVGLEHVEQVVSCRLWRCGRVGRPARARPTETRCARRGGDGPPRCERPCIPGTPPASSDRPRSRCSCCAGPGRA